MLKLAVRHLDDMARRAARTMQQTTHIVSRHMTSVKHKPSISRSSQYVCVWRRRRRSAFVLCGARPRRTLTMPLDMVATKQRDNVSCIAYLFSPCLGCHSCVLPDNGISSPVCIVHSSFAAALLRHSSLSTAAGDTAVLRASTASGYARAYTTYPYPQSISNLLHAGSLVLNKQAVIVVLIAGRLSRRRMTFLSQTDTPQPSTNVACILERCA